MNRWLRWVIALWVISYVTIAEEARAADVVLWHAYRGAERLALERIVERWAAANPSIAVETLAVPFDAYASKLEAAIPHGNGPDVFIDAHERLGDYRTKNLVAPLDGVDPGSFDAASIAAVSLDGRIHAAPLARKCLAMYVRDDRWPSGGPASLDALDPRRERLAYVASNAYMHAPLLHAVGGSILDERGGSARYAFADGPAESSLQWVSSATKRGLIPEEASGSLVAELFAKQSAASIAGADYGYPVAIDGPWLAGDLPATLRYHVIPIPPITAGGGAPRPFLTVEGAMLAPKPRNLAAARALIDALLTLDAQHTRAVEGRQIVASRAVWSLPDVANDRFLAGFASAADGAIPMPTSAAMRAAWEPTTRAIAKVLRGDASARDAMAEAARRYADVTRPAPAGANPRWLLLCVGALATVLAGRGLMRARDPALRAELRASLPAYAYVAHAVVIVGLLVVVPLVIGAVTSLFYTVREADGQSLRYVGFANYWDILTARGGELLASGSFYAVLLVTILWTLCNLALHLALGVSLALLLSRPALALRGVYRVLLVVPWAVPSYVSALAWRGMFHRQLGAVNAMLALFHVEPIAWFSRFSTAFAANVATNVWLGFPFMMVVTLGALTSISREVLEAAEVDGATRWQRFRYVTLPLLRPILAPSVVLGAVWTFNMFNVVFLVSGGEPDGRTEILVSEAYRWAFTRQAQYGYASAYAVLIFLLLLGGTRLIDRLRTAD